MKELGKVDLKGLADRWPSGIVAREKIAVFTGGAISPKRLANLDSEGAGPRGRFRCGRKVCYSVESLVDWLEERSEFIIKSGMKEEHHGNDLQKEKEAEK